MIESDPSFSLPRSRSSQSREAKKLAPLSASASANASASAFASVVAPAEQQPVYMLDRLLD